ncbi:MAG TPA: 6-pyruvoyl-tetrahydropterin synthase-related protein [Candidatus Woesebacteria bacterium]|nr:6-pyruvoyl-tetrahydropterin synthase-related protein [Candidatus Woesebacteria bacterium]
MISFIKKHRYLLILLLAIIPTISFLLKPNEYWNMHDDMQVIRQLSMEKCLKDGQIPCRWSPDLGYGYGYPLFNFYPPMPYFVGQVFRTFGFNYLTTVKLTALTQIVLSTLAMYLLASSIFGSFGGLVSAIFYAYAPYHALNIYVRGAMNEAWAAVFFPLIFHFSRKLIIDKKISSLILFSLSFSGLLLSHNPMALTFTLFLFIWVLFFLYQNYRSIKDTLQTILKLFISAIFSLSLTAFYTIPVLLETKYVQIETMFQNYYHWSVHFTSLKQLFISNYWGDGASVWGQDDRMSFMVGYLHWLLPLFLILYFIFSFVKTKKISTISFVSLLTALMGFFAAFMTHERSAFIWLLISPIQKIQFPWRFLNHSVFLLSISVGIIPSLFSSFKKYSLYLSSLILLIVVFLNISYFTPITHGPISEQQKLSGKAWVNQVTSGIYDYLPKTARIAAQGPAKDFVDSLSPEVKYQVTNAKKGTNWQMFDLFLEKSTNVTLPILSYPIFKVYDNNQLIDYSVEPELGRLVVSLSSGNHQLFIKLTDTPDRTISNIISLLAWLSLLIYLLINYVIRPRCQFHQR